MRIARLQLAAGDPDGALYHTHRALQGRPDDPAALTLVVEIQSAKGDFEKADAALKTLFAKHPDRAETSRAAGNVAMARGQYGAAVTAYRTAIAREQSTENALHVARAYLAAGEAAKAAAFLQTWSASRPDDARALKALAESQFRAGQLQPGRQSYMRVLSVGENDAATLNNFANLLHRLNDPSAQSYAEKALKLAPHEAAVYDTLGWILVQRGQIEPGLRYLREARLRSPENGDIRFHLAYALSKSSRENEAREELKAALSAPSRVENSDAVKLLKKELGV